MKTGTQKREQGGERRDPPGIVISRGAGPIQGPVITAFIWGGRVRPTPTLPYGRWKLGTP